MTHSAKGKKKLTAEDRDLIQVAEDTLRRTYRPGRHTVSAALRTASGRIYAGINIETTHGPCAEPVAIGAALTNDDRAIEAIVAVRQRGNGYEVLPPCGTCRQILIDYAPDAIVIHPSGRGLAKARAKDLLPGAYLSFD